MGSDDDSLNGYDDDGGDVFDEWTLLKRLCLVAGAVTCGALRR